MLTPAAIPGRLAALDIGVTSPASAAGGDATLAMFERKVHERADVRDELEQQNIVYCPLVWTHFGRPHPAATDAVRQIARRVARKRGGVALAVVERKMHAAISVALALRAARMSLACWPQHIRAGQADAAVEVALVADPPPGLS